MADMNEFPGGTWLLIILFFLMGFGGNGLGNNGAVTNEILSGQKFQGLDNKIDRIGNGIADATFSLNNSIVNEGRALSDKLCATNAAIHEEGEKTRELLQANKIAALEQKIAELQTAQAMAGVVRYPMQSTWAMQGNPFCGCNNAF